ncbi:hypothetical protein SUGI_0402560 [Cryptomeria japonica]|nr:hypothetical protein SUGI_0402560 [Cryptomeria japonica]
MAVWPNFIGPMLSDRFVKIMLKKLKERKPRHIQSIELQEFSLGLAPPILDLQRTYRSITGSQTIPVTELPGVSPWLEKNFIKTLTRTMVEPRRECLSLSAVNSKKRAVGGILSVTVVSASNIFKLNTKGAIPDRRMNSYDDINDSDFYDHNFFKCC